MARRSSGGVGAVLGFLLILGLVIQVVKLLVVPLTILAIGAVVIVPIYLVTRSRRNDGGRSLPAAPQTTAAPEDDGIISHDEVIQLLPGDIASTLTTRPDHEPASTDAWSDRWTTHGSADIQRPSGSGRPTTEVYQHGSCPIRHRSLQAAAKCRNG